MKHFFFLVLWILLGTAAASAQLPLNAIDLKKIDPLFDSVPNHSLKCGIQPWNPTLDFTFRFVAGYMVHCQLAQFEGKQAAVIIYLRVTPERKAPSLFGSAFHLPEISPEMRNSAGKNFRKMKNEVAMSGAFGVGKGSYFAEVLVVDDHERYYHKKWRVRVDTSRAERSVPIAIQPLTVETLERKIWQNITPRANGIRVTILLDAAPINPYQSRLRAWDRAFLLQWIYSLLDEIPHSSVHLVAFNLEQQEELFRNDAFDAAAFQQLSKILSGTETTTISVQALKKRNSPDFLAKLTNQELAANRSDAIIFLGPNGRVDMKTSATLLSEKKPKSPPIFYFEYFPWPVNFPDEIQSLVKAADGATFKIHTPAQLDQAIQKMLTQLKQN